MNLYLRLLWTLLRARRMSRLTLGDTLERQFRVLPNDLDLNGHMNNGRYLTMIDLMLIEYFVRCGFASVMWRNGWRPMAGGSFISYRRGLKPLQTYRLRFRLEACDAQWNYMRFEFHDGDRLCAAGYVKGTSVGRQGFVPNAESYAALGMAPPAAALPPAVASWLAAEREAVGSAW
jgi:acyl-CoA thioesterase FadM